MTQEERRRTLKALGETIGIIERYRVKGHEWLRLSGEGEIMARYEQHRDKLMRMLDEHEAAMAWPPLGV